MADSANRLAVLLRPVRGVGKASGEWQLVCGLWSATRNRGTIGSICIRIDGARNNQKKRAEMAQWELNPRAVRAVGRRGLRCACRQADPIPGPFFLVFFACTLNSPSQCKN